MAKKGEGKAVPKNTTKMIRCGNDECWLKGECRRYDETCEIKLVCRKRKCEHFVKI
jgi:hypothetical protein